MKEDIQCPSCGNKITIEGALTLKPRTAQCPSCNVVLKSEGVSFLSFIVKMLVSILVMSVGLASLLFYVGVSESLAKNIGFVATFILLFFLLKRAKKWVLEN